MTQPKKRKKKTSQRKNILDPIDRAILQTLTIHRRPLTANEIGTSAIIGWATVVKRLNKLERLKKVKRSVKGKRTFWRRIKR